MLVNTNIIVDKNLTNSLEKNEKKFFRKIKVGINKIGPIKQFVSGSLLGASFGKIAVEISTTSASALPILWLQGGLSFVLDPLIDKLAVKMAKHKVSLIKAGKDLLTGTVAIVVAVALGILTLPVLIAIVGIATVMTIYHSVVAYNQYKQTKDLNRHRDVSLELVIKNK